MIMHPYFSSQIAPEAISENPNSIILGSMFQRYNIRSGEIQWTNEGGIKMKVGIKQVPMSAGRCIVASDICTIAL